MLKKSLSKSTGGVFSAVNNEFYKFNLFAPQGPGRGEFNTQFIFITNNYSSNFILQNIK